MPATPPRRLQLQHDTLQHRGFACSCSVTTFLPSTLTQITQLRPKLAHMLYHSNRRPDDFRRFAITRGQSDPLRLNWTAPFSATCSRPIRHRSIAAESDALVFV